MNKLDRKAVFILAAESLFELNCSTEEFEQYALTLMKLGKAIEKQEAKSADLMEYRQLLRNQSARMNEEIRRRIESRQKMIESTSDVEELLKIKAEYLKLQLIEELNSRQVLQAMEASIRGAVIDSLGLYTQTHRDETKKSYTLNSNGFLYARIKEMLEPALAKANKEISEYVRSPNVVENLESGLDVPSMVQRFARVYREELHKRIENTWSDQVRRLVDQRLLEIRNQAESKDPAVAMELLSFVLSLQVKF